MSGAQGQTEGLLADWVEQQLAPGARVAWQGGQGEGARRLEAAGWRVLHLPPGAREPLQALRAFAPDTVVLEGGQELAPLEDQVRAALEAAPAARLLLEVRNASCASSLLQTLVAGTPAVPALTARALEQLALRAGARIIERRGVRAATPETGLARPTERALLGLLGQLAPESEVGHWRCILAREQSAALAAPRVQPPVPGLLSVVVRDAAPVPGPLEDEALFALACQDYQPLEVVLVGAAPGGWRERLERYRSVGGFSLQLVEGTSADGVRRARGQYLALLDSDCVVYPGHYAQLIGLLRSGERAWAVARARKARTGAAQYIESKLPVPLGETLGLAHLRQEPVLRSAFVVDRARIGSFSLEAGDPELQTLPLRLAALFEPHFARGIPTLETRVAAVGGEQGLEVPVPPLQALRTLAALAALEQGGAAGPAAPTGLRHHLLDELNEQLLHRAPALHARLKRWARGWVRRAAAERGKV